MVSPAGVPFDRSWSLGWLVGGVTVSTGLQAAERHAGVWAPVIAYKNTIANNNLALAA